LPARSFGVAQIATTLGEVNWMKESSGPTREEKPDNTVESTAAPDTNLTRRDFIRDVAAISAISPLGPAATVTVQQAAAPSSARKTLSADTFIGIQMGPHSLFDEGIERCLNLMRDPAAVHAVMVYSQTYHMDMRRPRQTLAPDHGVPLKEMSGRKLPQVWMKTHEQYYQHTVLRHQQPDSTCEYADRDLFAELVEPTRKRGMKLYARILEGSGSIAAQSITNFSQVRAQDVFGQPASFACWNNPDYRNWWTGTVEDMFRSYQLDGLQWGAERHGPLMTTLLSGRAPFCFCVHCQARCQAKGINVDRARQGFTELCAGVRALQHSPPGTSGAFAGLLRVLLRYPEVLGWEYQYRWSREETAQAIYKTVKAIKPAAQVGWHVDHQQSSWDQVYRAEMTYGEMAAYSDFIKPIVYHDILAPRIRWWYLDRLQKSVLSEIPLDESLDFYYATFGYDRKREPSVEQLDKSGFSPDYVYRETKRTVVETAGKASVYPGIGFDVPWNEQHYPSAPENVYQAVVKGFDAGADGIVVSREYDEMRLPNLKAVGAAVKELTRAQA
jgi:hypothetical protein